MKFFILVLFFMPTLVLAQCEQYFKTSELCAQIKWQKKPKTAKPVNFELSFFKKDDKKKVPVDPKREVNIFTWMKMNNGHDHGGPGVVIERKENTWHVSKARFFGGMSGSWWVRVELKEDKKVLEMNEFPVEL